MNIRASDRRFLSGGLTFFFMSADCITFFACPKKVIKEKTPRATTLKFRFRTIPHTSKSHAKFGVHTARGQGPRTIVALNYLHCEINARRLLTHEDFERL
jgi:hypothetical protein